MDQPAEGGALAGWALEWCVSGGDSAARRREGTHAKGSCEPGQTGRSSHKQRPLVQWIILFRRSAAALTPAGRTLFLFGCRST